MGRKMPPRRIIAFLVFGTISLPVLAATNQLTPDEIKAVFANGKPFTAVSTSGMAYRLTLNADGSTSEIPAHKQSGKQGKWHLSDKGYCSKWGNHNEHCYTVEKNGSRYDVLDSGGHLISNWTR
jgi:hypothetical protein